MAYCTEKCSGGHIRYVRACGVLVIVAARAVAAGAGVMPPLS
jgi:hypothetical protein